MRGSGAIGELTLIEFSVHYDHWSEMTIGHIWLTFSHRGVQVV